jgi:hypothetical protein
VGGKGAGHSAAADQQGRRDQHGYLFTGLRSNSRLLQLPEGGGAAQQQASGK